MKKILYVSVNSKPEELSTSKTVARKFINRLLTLNNNYEVEELDLYSMDIPEINYRYFTGRGQVVTGKAYEELSQEDKKSVDTINKLTDQFLEADLYIIAAPMWSLSFPSKLKAYLDCIIQNGKLIKVNDKEVEGLLDDKERNMVYIQSSGGVYPKIFSGKINHGINYVEDIFKFLGVKKFKKILVQGVDMEDVGKEEAISRSIKDIEDIVEKL